MTKTLLFCTVVPALGTLAVASVLVAAMWIGQGLWGLLWMR